MRRLSQFIRWVGSVRAASRRQKFTLHGSRTHHGMQRIPSTCAHDANMLFIPCSHLPPHPILEQRNPQPCYLTQPRERHTSLIPLPLIPLAPHTSSCPPHHRPRDGPGHLESSAGRNRALPLHQSPPDPAAAGGAHGLKHRPLQGARDSAVTMGRTVTAAARGNSGVPQQLEARSHSGGRACMWAAAVTVGHGAVFSVKSCEGCDECMSWWWCSRHPTGWCAVLMNCGHPVDVQLQQMSRFIRLGRHLGTQDEQS